MRALLYLVIIGLTVYALADVATSDERSRHGVPKVAWLVIALVPVVGPLVWILARRAGRAAGEGGPGVGGGNGPAPRGPVAPDDDPEFLWRLEQDRIRRERDARRAGGEDPDGPRPTDGDVPGEGARG